MTIRNEDVKRLRDETGIGIMDCKKALTEADGDLGRAKEILREKGLDQMGQLEQRKASEGRIAAYVHHSAKVGVLVEISCNTDFAANSDDVVRFVHDLALHIAAGNPRFVSPDDVSPETLEVEKEAFRKQLEEEGKPAQIIEKALEGRLKRFYRDACLLKQPFVKDPETTIEEMLADLRTKTGENIQVEQFTRYEITDSPA